MKEDASQLSMTAAQEKDLDELADFNARIHQDPRVVITMQDLVRSGKLNPQSGILIVRDTASGKIVSSCCLIPHIITYQEICLKVGMPEFVGTDPAYRKMGLISRQFAELHRWSEIRGDDLQLIGGIPYFYRQYGYEMTLSLEARRVGTLADLEAQAGIESTLLFKPATILEIPALMRLFAQENRRSLVSHFWSELDWQYAILDEANGGCAAKHTLCITRPDGTLLGAVKIHRFIEEDRFLLCGAEIDPALTTWEEVAPAILNRYHTLARTALQMEQKPIKELGLALSKNHPLYARLAPVFPQEKDGYAWYVRVPQLTSFLRKIAPVLEGHLQNSPYQGLNRTIHFNGYTIGLEMEFVNGCLVRLDPWQAKSYDDGDFLCPEKVFYHLVFGHRSFEEVHSLHADCYAKKDTATLINALFPKQISALVPVI